MIDQNNIQNKHFGQENTDSDSSHQRESLEDVTQKVILTQEEVKNSVPEDQTPPIVESRLDKVVKILSKRPLKDNILAQGFGTISILLIPGGVIKSAVESLGYPSSISNLAALITAVVAGIVFFGVYVIPFLKNYFNRIIIIFLLSFSLFLFGWLIWIQYFTADPWIDWKDKISLAVSNCKKKEVEKEGIKKYEIEDASCVVRAIKSNTYPTTEEYKLPSGEKVKLESAQLENDLRAGQYLMKNQLIFDLLEKKLGIKTSFLGTGITLPANKTDYSEARMPEYLIPNESEEESSVWTWQLNPKELEIPKTVGTIIKNTQLPPSNIKPDSDRFKNLESWLNLIEKQRFDEKKPALIRINQFDPQKYSKRLGRDDASQVFAIPLSDVWDMPLADAITYCGHIIDKKNGNKTLFIWVYLPSDDYAAVPATWGNIINKIDVLIK